MIPEGKYVNRASLEVIKPVLSEIQKDNLRLLSGELDELVKSLYGKGDVNSINHITGEILRQQKRDIPNAALIDGLNLQLMAAYAPIIINLVILFETICHKP